MSVLLARGHSHKQAPGLQSAERRAVLVGEREARLGA